MSQKVYLKIRRAEECRSCECEVKLTEDQLLRRLRGTLIQFHKQDSISEPPNQNANEVGLTAVSTTCPSVSSTLPPGRAVCPGCERRVLDRVVSSTLRWPSFS